MTVQWTAVRSKLGGISCQDYVGETAIRDLCLTAIQIREDGESRTGRAGYIRVQCGTKARGQFGSSNMPSCTSRGSAEALQAPSIRGVISHPFHQHNPQVSSTELFAMLLVLFVRNRALSLSRVRSSYHHEKSSNHLPPMRPQWPFRFFLAIRPNLDTIMQCRYQAFADELVALFVQGHIDLSSSSLSSSQFASMTAVNRRGGGSSSLFRPAAPR